MYKIISLVILLMVFSLPGYSNDEAPEATPPFISLTIPGATQSVQQEHSLWSQLEANRFFLWRWLFGDSKFKNGGPSRVSRSQGLVRAPLAKPSKRNLRSLNPAELGSPRRRPSSNSLSPTSVGGKFSPSKSNSTNPGSLGGSSSAVASGSKSPASLSKGTSRKKSNSTSFQNEPRPPVGPSRRNEYFGQSHRELGLSFGTSHAFTTLAATSEMGFGDAFQYHIQNPNLAIGAFARFRINEWFGLGLSVDYTKLTGTDQRSEPEEFASYSYENKVLEIGGKVEFFVPMKFGSPLDIYGFAGLAAIYNDLDLMDENGIITGTTSSSNPIQPAIPMGVGFNVRINPKVKIGYEFGYRYLVFHFLDGIMVPGSPYDSYLHNQIKVSYALPSRTR